MFAHQRVSALPPLRGDVEYGNDPFWYSHQLARERQRQPRSAPDQPWGPGVVSAHDHMRQIEAMQAFEESAMLQQQGPPRSAAPSVWGKRMSETERQQQIEAMHALEIAQLRALGPPLRPKQQQQQQPRAAAVPAYRYDANGHIVPITLDNVARSNLAEVRRAYHLRRQGSLDGRRLL